MQTGDETLIRVHREWDGWRSAEVRLSDLQNVDWLQPNRAPHPLVHAYIACSNILTGDIPHDCDHASAPHRLLVCVLKKHTIPTVYAELARRADEQQTLPPDRRAVSGGTSTIRGQRTSGSMRSSLSSS